MFTFIVGSGAIGFAILGVSWGGVLASTCGLFLLGVGWGGGDEWANEIRCFVSLSGASLVTYLIT